MGFNTATVTFDTVTDLKGNAGSVSNERATLLGYNSVGDDGGGEFYWNSTSTATVDNGVVFAVTGVMTGRWIRLFNTSLNPRYYGAKGDSTTDDSTAFSNCLNSAYSSNIYITDGTYVVQSISVNGTKSITVSEKATLLLKASSPASAYVFNLGGQYTTLNGGVIDCNKANQTNNNFGIIIGADDVTIQGVEIKNSSHYGIYGNNVNRPVVQNCYIHDTDYIALFFQATTSNVIGGLIEGNRIDRFSSGSTITEGALKVRGNVSPAQTSIRWRIIGNFVLMPDSPTDSSAMCIELLAGNHNSTVADNITIGGHTGISVGTSNYVTVTGNTCERSAAYGIEISGCTFNTVTGNTILGDALITRGIVADASGSTLTSNLTITGNAIYNTTQNGVYLATNTKYVAISANSISLCASGSVPYAINMDSPCSFVNITSNQLLGNSTTAKGLLFNDGTYITVSSNSFDSFTQDGILMVGTGSNVTDNISIVNNVFNYSAGTALAFQNNASATMGSNIVVLGNTGLKNYLDFKNEVLLITGSGTPQSAVTASVGAQFLRNDGGASTTLYIKESGTNTNTGWIAK